MFFLAFSLCAFMTRLDFFCKVTSSGAFWLCSPFSTVGLTLPKATNHATLRVHPHLPFCAGWRKSGQGSWTAWVDLYCRKKRPRCFRKTEQKQIAENIAAKWKITRWVSTDRAQCPTRNQWPWIAIPVKTLLQDSEIHWEVGKCSSCSALVRTVARKSKYPRNSMQ